MTDTNRRDDTSNAVPKPGSSDAIGWESFEFKGRTYLRRHTPVGIKIRPAPKEPPMPDINKNADLVERLRSLASFIARGLTPHPSRAATLSEAADTIETQAAEIARLRDPTQSDKIN